MQNLVRVYAYEFLVLDKDETVNLQSKLRNISSDSKINKRDVTLQNDKTCYGTILHFLMKLNSTRLCFKYINVSFKRQFM